jgi:hypothetical protein
MPPQKPEGASLLEDYINHLIDQKLQEHGSSINKEDAEEIVKFLMPEFEKLISKIVLKHLRAIATYTLKELKEE